MNKVLEWLNSVLPIIGVDKSIPRMDGKLEKHTVKVYWVKDMLRIDIHFRILPSHKILPTEHTKWMPK